MHRERGFTLLELMIVVVVIAILAAIALPSYTDYIRRGKFTEAHGQLADLRVKMEQYYMDNRNYGTTALICPAGVPMPAGVQYFTYSCNWGAVATNQGYTITATGNANEGLTGIAFTVDQANTKATTVTAATAMATAGYTSNAGCWIRKRPNQC